MSYPWQAPNDTLTLDWIQADAGHDSEANHEYARDHHGIRSIIPP